MEPTGPREAQPDDRLREIRVDPDCGAPKVARLHPGYTLTD
jgi:hypothetical protein